MKLDLVEINKFTPPGLWDLGVLSAFITALLRVSTSGAGLGSGLVYVRMAARYRRQLRERTLDNLNMRIKAWVMLCPLRIACVRSIIGEAAIKHWQKNRLLGYALSKYFGDWKRKWPNGFAGPNSETMRKTSRIFMGKPRAYKWKLFALTKIENVYGFLYGRTMPDPENEDIRAAHLKLWGVDIMDVDDEAKWQQPRPKRVLKPVEFTPYELVPDENTSGEVLDVTEDEKSITVQKTFHTPKEPEKITKNKVKKLTVHKPP